MKKIKFWKMSGSGNDFILLDNRRRTLRGTYAALARRLCHRQFGVGADGLLVLEPDPSLDFRMVYYNADGSRASMCGNGARCMAYFAHARGAVGRRFSFRTDAYPVTAEVRPSDVCITLSKAVDWRPLRRVRAGGKTYSVAGLHTGVPHVVVFVRRLSRIDVAREGALLRRHRAFGPKGTNVNFVEVTGGRSLRVRTFERGVEGETLACGTGVAASAIAAALTGRVREPVNCRVAGGDTLQVRFHRRKGEGDEPVQGVTLRGPVRVTFKGEAYV